MQYRILICCFLFAGYLLTPAISHSQIIDKAPKTTTRTAEDSMVTIEILPGVRKLEFRKIDDSTQIQILAGNVKLKQGTTLFDCDSCVINNNTNIFEAWGHVHINDADTSQATSSHLLYIIRKKIAYLDGGVTLTDGKGTLTTPDLEYDVDTKIGIYKNGGKVVNKKTVLTSAEGYYYTDLKDVYFKKNVVMIDPAYTIKTDSMLYNTETGTVRFIAETFIRDSSGRTIQTKEGYYDLQTGKAEFAQRPVIKDGKITITANQIAMDDSTGESQAKGNAIIVDSANQTTIIAGMIFRNKKTEAILAVQKPLMIIKQEKDSIFITADTLFSARLSDLYTRMRRDSLIRDSIRIIQEAFVNRRDSLTKDSIKAAHPIVIKKDSMALDSSKINAINLQDSTHRDSSIVIPPAESIKKDSSILEPVKIEPPINVKDSILRDTAKNAMISIIKNERLPRDSNQINIPAIPRNDSIKGDSIRIKPVNQKDSIGMDTLNRINFSKMSEHDSTNRYFEAYRHVRIFSDSMQAVSDSMFYSFKDSIFRLFQQPVVWSNKSQITGDTILLFTRNKKADRVKVFNNSFMVNRLDPEVYNQIKSSRMDGYFLNGEIDSVRCIGSAECIYYIQDEDSAYTGINQSKSDIIDIYFANKELKKVVFRTSVTGTIWPIKQKNPKEMRLQGFQWLEDRRPKSKFELFE